jgi:hypothetical protein
MPPFDWRRVVIVARAMLPSADRDASHRMGVTDRTLPRDNKRDGNNDQQQRPSPGAHGVEPTRSLEERSAAPFSKDIANGMLSRESL